MIAEAIRDDQYHDHTIASLKPGKDGWEVGLSNGFCVWCPDNGVTPEVGDTIRLYGKGKGLGGVVRGIVINGEEVFYRTEQQDQERRRQQIESWNSEKQQKAEAARSERESQVAKLPRVFQDRIARLRRNNKDFWWKHEDYELATCQEAVKIAEVVHARMTASGKNAEDEIKSLHKLPCDEVRRIVNLDIGVSANMVNAAFRLAFLYLDHPDLVDKEHGAMCPIVGCEEYGCYAAEKEAVNG